jgi:aminocarboxymuconate-semialdehyde decarboxylase
VQRRHGRAHQGLIVLKIDIHTHILPREWPDLAAKYGKGAWVQLEHTGPGCARMLRDGQPFRDITANAWDPAVRLAEYDAAGVQVQALSTVPVMFSYWAKPEHAHDLARFLNDHIATVVQTDPRRFVGLGTLPLQDTDRAVQELERCVRELGFPGVQIGTHCEGTNLDDPRLFPVFQAAEALGACVFVHPWDMLGGQRLEKYWMPWLVGMPTETTVAIASMMFGGVFERLPRLRVAFAHGGGSFPGTFGRLVHGFECRPDLVAVANPVHPREYLGRFWLDSLVHDAKLLEHLIELVGADRVALGSDYPFPLGETVPGALIDAMNLSKETRAHLFHGAALEWLGLDGARFA